MGTFGINSSSYLTLHRTHQEEVNKMGRYKKDNSDQGKFIPVSFQDQIHH
jgi:hypothetical protein